MIELTPLELKVLKLVCQDKNNNEISEKVDYSLRYVERMKFRLYKKTRTKSNIGLLKWAVLNGVYAIKK